jgi:dTDP-4-dehydrorhamnose 3,5-epimerase
VPTAIPDVKIVQPAVFHDERGFFLEGWNRETMAKAGIDAEFVQDNHSWSRRGVLRGLHYQLRRPQGKLVRVVSGTVFDVVVDLRRRSPTFGKWVGLTLSHESFQTVWIPPGFAHGFLVLSESADFLYKTTDYRVPDDERTLLWNDPAIGIAWPLEGEPILTAKDAGGAPVARADLYE